jgi:serine phosphatase RsbU (regulator of sigma subunit)/DNA-binding LacI/PurR family transcriptional regulator
MTNSSPAKSNRARPTIGYLAPRTGDSVSQALWRGVVGAARERDVNLISFPGDRLRYPDGAASPGNVLYELVSSEVVDGLVSWASSVGGSLEYDETVAFHRRYRPIPIVSITLPMAGCPTVLIDSYAGMRDMLAHLIEFHGYRRLAFIHGPETHFYAQERYRAYVEGLEAYDIPLDPNLVTEYGDFAPAAGVEGIGLLLDDRSLRPKIDFEAVVTVSDLPALGALRELQTRGIRVPEDVALVGFNDSRDGRFVTPPLTSVRLPFQEQGRRAVELLLAQMAGEQVPEQVVLPASLRVRQSCGCMLPSVVQAAAKLSQEETDVHLAAGQTLEAAFAACRDATIDDMVQAAESSAKGLGPDWTARLLETFVAEVAGEQGAEGTFLQEMDYLLRQVVAVDGQVGGWQNVISALRRRALPCLYNVDVDMLHRADDLWAQTWVRVGETAQRAEAQRALREAQQATLLRDIGQELATTPDVADLAEVLVRALPQLGIRRAYLSLYEDPRNPTGWSRLVLGYDENGRMDVGESGLRFPSCQLAPEGVLSREQRHSLVAEPLYYLERQLGFVLLDEGTERGEVYDALRGEISSALQGALLTEQVARRAVQLQTAAEVSHSAMSVLEQDKLIQQVVELVQERFDLYYVGLFLISSRPDNDQPGDTAAWAVLRKGTGEAGRQMMEQGHRLRVGGGSMVGQCITDHQPRVALDVGVEAVRFSNPLLPETRSELALPLVTREGAIGALSIQSKERGAFGEEEIAVFETMAGQLANAMANARAYDEIRILSEQLRDESLRMRAELAVTQRLQQMLLPTEDELRAIEGLDIAGFMEPAEEVGGDYYDVLKHNGDIKIGIGDVTGHGLESGVVMLMLQTAVRTLLISDEEDPRRFLSILNRLLCDNTERMQVSKSISLALLDYHMGRMAISGQHEQVIVMRKDGRMELEDTMALGLPLGLVGGMADFVQKTSIDLQPEDGIVLYSDGVTEAENEAGELYGLERLCQVVKEHWGERAEEVKDAIVADVRGYIGQQKVHDDITLVVVKQE